MKTIYEYIYIYKKKKHQQQRRHELINDNYNTYNYNDPYVCDL